MLLVHVVSNLPHEVVCLVVCWCRKMWCISKERFLFRFKQKARKGNLELITAGQAVSWLCHSSSWSHAYASLQIIHICTIYHFIACDWSWDGVFKSVVQYEVRHCERNVKWVQQQLQDDHMSVWPPPPFVLPVTKLGGHFWQEVNVGLPCSSWYTGCLNLWTLLLVLQYILSNTFNAYCVISY